MEIATDPVCGMNAVGSKLTSQYAGKTYFFCGLGCKAEFDEDPEMYVKGRSQHRH